MVCILKVKAPKIKTAITKLQELGIDFNVNSSLGYWECLKDNIHISKCLQVAFMIMLWEGK